MGALNALQRSPGALARNPVLVIPVLIIGLFQIPQLLLQTINPLLASLASLVVWLFSILVMPFFQAGIIGMADEALDRRTRLNSFIAVGKEHYVTILVAYLLLFVITVIVFVVSLIISFILGIIFLPNLEFSGFAIGAVGLLFGISYLPMLIFVFFVQFYGQAIVLDNERSMDAIRRSVNLVRQNVLSTLGYSIIGAVFGGGLGLVLGGLSMLASPQPAQFYDLPQVSFSTLTGAILVVVVIGSVVGSFLAIFSVAFYREIAY